MTKALCWWCNFLGVGAGGFLIGAGSAWIGASLALLGAYFILESFGTSN